MTVESARFAFRRRERAGSSIFDQPELSPKIPHSSKRQFGVFLADKELSAAGSFLRDRSLVFLYPAESGFWERLLCSQKLALGHRALLKSGFAPDRLQKSAFSWGELPARTGCCVGRLPAISWLLVRLWRTRFDTREGVRAGQGEWDYRDIVLLGGDPGGIVRLVGGREGSIISMRKAICTWPPPAGRVAR